MTDATIRQRASARGAGAATIAGAARALRAGEVTSVDLVRAALRRAEETDEILGVFLARYDEQALRAAGAADAELAAGVDRGVLHGIPLGIKDILATVEGPTTANSLVHDPEWYRGRDAASVARLRAAGAIVVGKTSLMEHAVGTPDVEKPFPLPRNPWDTAAWPGGSSTGSGSGLVAGMFLGALGTDTAGSIRIPGGWCGITGLKPTYGRVPKSGCLPLAHLLDTVGPMARSAEDCAVLLAAIAGHDPEDPASAEEPVADYSGALTGDLTGLRIGLDPLTEASQGVTDPAQPGLLAAFAAELRAAGASVVDLSVPYYEEVSAVTQVTLMVEAFAHHAPALRSRWGDYGRGARMHVTLGALLTGADYVQAQRVRRAGQRAIARLFRDVDLIVTPLNTQGAPSVSAMDPLTPLTGRRGRHTRYWSALGNPTMTVPIGFTAAGLPIGAQITGRPFAEATVLRAGDAFQRRTDWHLRTPPPPAAPADVPAAGGGAPPEPSAADLATVSRLLATAGVAPPPEEVSALARMYPLLRRAADGLHAATEAGRHEPATRWSARL